MFVTGSVSITAKKGHIIEAFTDYSTNNRNMMGENDHTSDDLQMDGVAVIIKENTIDLVRIYVLYDPSVDNLLSLGIVLIESEWPLLLCKKAEINVKNQKIKEYFVAAKSNFIYDGDSADIRIKFVSLHAQYSCD
jgi:hypothetical protein